jgi:hypothetical protein
MRALLIDPETQTISEINFEGDYKDIQRTIGCDRFASGSRPLNGSLETGSDSLYVSDDDYEDRDPGRYWFQVDVDRNPPSSYPLAGKGLVLGVDENGATCAARISLDELYRRITFTQRKFLGFDVSKGPGQIGVTIKAPLVDGATEDDDK